jgi:hypothetical protein
MYFDCFGKLRVSSVRNPSFQPIERFPKRFLAALERTMGGLFNVVDHNSERLLDKAYIACGSG